MQKAACSDRHEQTTNVAASYALCLISLVCPRTAAIKLEQENGALELAQKYQQEAETRSREYFPLSNVSLFPPNFQTSGLCGEPHEWLLDMPY